MSLQRRLTLFFVLIVILPLTVAGFLVHRVVVGEVSRRALLSLDPALDATVALYTDRVEALDARVRGTVGLAQFADILRSRQKTQARDFLTARLSETQNLDFFIAFDKAGDRLTHVSVPGRFVEGYEPPSADVIAAAREGYGPGFVRTPLIPLKVAGEGRVGSVIGGFWLDQDLLQTSAQEDVHLSLAAAGQVVASTAELDGPVAIAPDLEEAFTTEIGEESQARAVGLDGGMAIIASTPVSPIAALSQRVLTSLLILLAVAALGTALLAYLLARLITQPINELAEGAQAIAEGRFDHHIETRSSDEVGQLAHAFNEMSERLRTTIGELSGSRDELSHSRDRLQRAVHRVGETLRSTHDMGQMLGSILNTAVDAVGADAGVIWRFNPTRSELYPGSVVGVEESELGRVAVGEGIAGHVAERAVNVLVPTASGRGPHPSGTEVQMPVAVVVPVYSQDRVTGALAVYREDPSRPFEAEDMRTVIFLAEQGGVAIENVMLHEEARRLSLMDGLTGIWNRRFFQMQFRQVLATAQRFERPFSILMLDLDYFKRVNDTYGHPRGDAILVEFAQRVSGALREVDTFARYGGEEFIVLLSETDVAGALTTAEKICDLIRSKPFGSVDEEPVSLTVSVGVAGHPTHGDNFQTLVQAADEALYAAKEEGRDRVILAQKGGSSRLRLA